ncbi:MAG: hypothetical protein IPO27_09810 [Bacteroidetes bacterium]|nr:hypothetical protein [Bacteroidota bacterium]
MFVTFDTLSNDSKVWIFQANRLLDDAEVALLMDKCKAFIDSWTSHNTELKASAIIKHQLFLIIGVDTLFANASGCSIDKAFRFVQDIGAHLKIDFFNRLNIAIEGGNQISIIKSQEITEQQGEYFFDNRIETKGELLTDWKKPLSQCWAL